MDTKLEDALKIRAYQLGKNVGDLTSPQIAEVEANPDAYLPEPEPEPPEPVEAVAEAEEVAVEAHEEVSEPSAKPRKRTPGNRG